MTGQPISSSRPVVADSRRSGRVTRHSYIYPARSAAAWSVKHRWPGRAIAVPANPTAKNFRRD